MWHSVERDGQTNVACLMSHLSKCKHSINKRKVTKTRIKYKYSCHLPPVTDSAGNTPAPPEPGNPAPLGDPLTSPGKPLTIFSCKVEANEEWPWSNTGS